MEGCLGRKATVVLPLFFFFLRPQVHTYSFNSVAKYKSFSPQGRCVVAFRGVGGGEGAGSGDGTLGIRRHSKGGGVVFACLMSVLMHTQSSVCSSFL